MPKFPYIANRYAPKDVFIEKVQRMLNYLRNRFHCGWPHLKVDGYYGYITADAVKGFLLWYTCKSNTNGILDARTYEQIEKAMNISPAILTQGKRIKKEDPIIIKVANGFMDSLKELDGIIKEEIEYAKSLGKFDAEIITQRFSYHISKLDPKIKKLQQLFKTNFENKNAIGTLSANTNQNIISKTYTQSCISQYQTKVNCTSALGKKLSKDFIKGLEKWNLLKKIETRMKQIGITGNLKIGDLKNIKIKAGGVFLAWSLKDIICDLFKYEEWGEENWKQDLLEHCYDFLDNLIIGFISTIIAQLIVVLSASAIAAASFITISAGWIIALVVILALIIGLVISSFIKKVCGDDASISKFIYEGSVTNILNTLYSI